LIAEIVPIDRFEKIRDDFNVLKPITFQSSIVSAYDDMNWIID
jgi:hypothetical protein